MGLVAFGKNTLKNLLNSEFLTFKKVIIKEEKSFEYRSFISTFDKRLISYEILKKENFQRFIPDKKHQGIVAFLEEYKYFNLEELTKKFFYKKDPFFVILDSIEDPHNFGAIIRTCAAFGVDAIIILDKNQVPVNSTVLKVSTGGLSYVPICKVSSLSQSIKNLKSKGFLIISTVCYDDMNKASGYSEKIYYGPRCVVFGNEHSGIRNKVINESDCFFSVPLKNKMNSLNVSVSFGVIVSFLKKIV